MEKKTMLNKEAKIFSTPKTFFTPTMRVESPQHNETAKPFFGPSTLIQRNSNLFPRTTENISGQRSTDNRFIHCDDKNKSLIQDAFNQAIIQVSAAISRLNNAIIDIDKKSPTDATTTFLLKYYFKTIKKNDLQFILSKFIALDNQMVTGLKFKCTQDPISCLDTGGYVNRIRFTPIRLGPIHICVDNFKNETFNDRIKIIIHEASHRYIKASDFGYFGIDAAKLTGHPEKAIKNADSYAMFALNS